MAVPTTDGWNGYSPLCLVLVLWPGVALMPRSSWTPSIVPSGDDQTVYLVLDDFGDLGRAIARPISSGLVWKPSFPICLVDSIKIR